MLKGRLPWQGMNAKTENEKDDLVYKMKKSISAQDLCEDLPSAMQKLFNYVRDEDSFQNL
jgi:casein kinase I family protein HRR25